MKPQLTPVERKELTAIALIAGAFGAAMQMAFWVTDLLNFIVRR